MTTVLAVLCVVQFGAILYIWRSSRRAIRQERLWSRFWQDCHSSAEKLLREKSR